MLLLIFGFIIETSAYYTYLEYLWLGECNKTVPIFKISEQVTLKIDGTKFIFRQTQFPLVLAYDITSHEAQGITKERVIIDYGSNHAKHALFSVPFSRAKTLEGIFFKFLERIERSIT